MEPILTQFAKELLCNRHITSEYAGTVKTGVVRSGTPQGGIISPLFWILTINTIVEKLNREGYHTVAYADDLVVLISGQFPEVLSGLMQTALDRIILWSGQNGLRANPGKTELVLFTRVHNLPVFPLPCMGNTQLTLASQVKYLGLILDRKLNWRTTVEDRIKKAITAFFTCKRMFGRNWGLRPQMVHWLYMGIVRPILTYGSLVWWTAVRRTTIQSELVRVQRLACLGITGALRTTPTAGLEIILGLQPLDLFIMGRAWMTATRIRCGGLLSVAPGRAYHASILRELGDGRSTQWQTLDYIPNKMDFNIKFKVTLPRREDWERGEVMRTDNGISIFTDGSKTEDGTGAGLFISDPNRSQSYRLESHVTVFQAEVFALLKAAELAMNVPADRVNLYSDSKAALLALASFRTNSDLVRGCRAALNELTDRATVELFWVPGHCGIVGNEKADELARAGSANRELVAETGIKTSLATAKANTDEYLWREMDSRWTSRADCKVSRTTWPHPNKGKSNKLLKWSRDSVRKVVGALTGHCLLREHAKRMRLTTDEMCRGCAEDSESAEHFLCHCPALRWRRFKFLGSHFFTELKDVAAVDPKKILRFCKSANWF